MKYNLKKKYQIALRRFYATENPAKEIANFLQTNKEGFRTHIDKYRLEGMDKNSFGKEWGLDHIVPVELFDLNNPIEQAICYHYLNIIPMFNNDNRMKGGSVHFSLEKLKRILEVETSQNNIIILNSLISKCVEEIEERYSKYLL